MIRNRVTVRAVRVVAPFYVGPSRPYVFQACSQVQVDITRTTVDGTGSRGTLVVGIFPQYITDGASTRWPASILVPPWRPMDDGYNAGPVAHDILYMLQGHVPSIRSTQEWLDLSREECDDILRGIWRCWGMSRFLAGVADKGIELFAGGKSHWGNDGYHVRDYARVYWRPDGWEAMNGHG